MKAIVKTKETRGFELCEVEMPEIKRSTDVKLQVLKSSVCGTDYHIYSWDNWSQKTINVPQINGHEVLAKIVEVGSEVTGFNVGQIVVCETHIYCGTCYQCQTGNAHVCENMSILGVNQDGIWCEYQVVPQNILVDVSGIDPKYAGIMEPLGNAIHTLGYSDVRGKNVLISGAGPIGVLAAYVAKISGASTVMISDFNNYRLDMVRDMDFGAHLIDLNTDDIFAKTKEITNGSGIDIAIEMSGNGNALNTSIELINPAGEINVLSVYPQDKIEVAMNELVFKNIKMQMVTGRKLFDTWYAASRWLRNGVLEADKLDHVITHEFKMEQFEEMFKIMETGKCGKMILDFTYLHEGE
ncbi:L-threonine 3-dehydrogenase [Mollicutes bacterium LVI A0039]|nr:L-threonine 3-dehydrogenase [Mollicutes bacterium LVI A0039]